MAEHKKKVETIVSNFKKQEDAEASYCFIHRSLKYEIYFWKRFQLFVIYLSNPSQMLDKTSTDINLFVR